MNENNRQVSHRFVGYRILEFSHVTKDVLQEVAVLLEPHKEEIVGKWVEGQLIAWRPPALGEPELTNLFGGLFANMLNRMRERELERCIGEFMETGDMLARSDFPFEALVMSLHFMEESYEPFLFEHPSERVLVWSVQIDEFLHAAIAAMATSYFAVYKTKLLEEAAAARIVENSLLPKIPLHAIDLELGQAYLSSSGPGRAGGDFIEVTRNSNRLSFIVGDFSGHGLEAATSAAKIRFIFRGFMREHRGLVDSVSGLNHILLSELEHSEFATVIAGGYEFGNIRLVLAGHPPPLIFTDSWQAVSPGGTPLGVSDEATYQELGVELIPGSVVIVYTDGLIEARRETELFGEWRVMEAAQGMLKAPAMAIAEQLRDAALRFAGGQLKDDAAILVLKRLG